MRLPLLSLLPNAVCVIDHGLHSGYAPSVGEQAMVAASVARRQAHFAAGRACAHQALETLGSPVAELLREESGAPRWPQAITGSIGHCDLAAVAIAAQTQHWLALGIDIEPDCPLAEDVTAYALTPAECAAFSEREGGLLRWSLAAFCAKECVHKCVHPLRGAFLEFDEVAIRFEGADRFVPEPRSSLSGAAFENLYLEGRLLRQDGLLIAVLAAREA